MISTKKNTITIIGAGIAGCFLALLFAKRGFKVHIYERLSKKQILDYSSNRSFNITFYEYGKNILTKTGLWDDLKKYIITLDGSVTQIGTISKPFDSKFDDNMPYFCISRTRLVAALLSKSLKNKRISIHFDTSLMSIDKTDKTIVVQNNKTKRHTQVDCDVVFGADGANSVARSFMQQGLAGKHSQEYFDWNYKQIALTKKYVSKIGLEKKVMYAWTRSEAIMLAFPGEKEGYNAMLILPIEGEHTFDTLTHKKIIKEFVADQFPSLLPALPEITSSIIQNPEGRFVTVHTTPWYYKDFIALVGDSAHAFMPFYGQGISCAFGDCFEIARLVDRYGTNWRKIFFLYQVKRQESMDMLGVITKDSFQDYRRYKRANYGAIYAKTEQVLHSLFPQYIMASTFVEIAKDPGKTASVIKRHREQRMILMLLGIPFIIGGLTVLVFLLESIGSVVTSTQRKSVSV